MVKIRDNILKLIALLYMKLLTIYNKYTKKEEDINLYTVWKFSSYDDGRKTEIFFTDKTGSVVIDIPHQEFRKRMLEAEPPAKSIIE